MPEHRARTADGGFIWLEGSPTLIRDESGRPKSIISSYRNVTDRREREDALAAARREAEAATRAKTEFLSNMSHEIRTPLNGILGFAKLAAETDLTAEQRDYVGSIQRAGKMLREIVDDILDFSKVEAGKIELDVQPFDIREAVRDVTALVEAGRTRKTAALSWTIAGLENTRILADEVRVRQVLLNLVGNAAKFTETGSITLSVSQSGEDIVFQISDTGRGIPRDKLAQVFEGFRQADATITRQYGGSGLGLSISRSLTRLMGGELELESVEGEGTVVTVRIPYKPAGEPVAQLPADIAQQAEEHTSDGARIMVVDDVDMNLSLIRHGLKHSGHVLETFSSPRAAFERLAAGEAFDIIFMDVQMPDLDGLTLTRMIRALDGPVSQTPIIALTAHTLPAHIQECLDAGMTDHLSKPVDLDRMKAMISGALAAGRQAEPAELPAPDPIAALRAEYRDYLGTISKEFDDILKKTEDQEATRAIEFLAHAIAGTAANFGFGAVSSAAFELEANARRQLKTGVQDRQSLTAQVARLVETSARAAAA
jgi:signal transduction histidine kinase/CheY-like chemotaxis protein/HPt (histidine-containing phosphotransfer) domain-containing protein